MAEDEDGITVLPADPPGEPIGFAIKEYLGSALRRRLPDGTLDPALLTLLEDVREGSEFLVPSLFGGYMEMTVERSGDGSLSAHSERTMAVLKFCEDDRLCWTVVALINKRGIERLEVKK